MDDEQTIILNDVLHSLSNYSKDRSKEQIIIELNKLYPQEEIRIAHDILLESLPVKKSTRHARRVKNSDPCIGLLDCFYLLNLSDLPVFLAQDSKAIECYANYIENTKIESIEFTEMEEISEQRTDFEELRDEQDNIRAQITGISRAVDELKNQMQLLTSPSAYCVYKPITNKHENAPRTRHKNWKTPNSSIGYMQTFTHQEDEIQESNGKNIQLFEEDSEEEFELDDFEGYPDSSSQEEAYKEISLVETSEALTDKLTEDMPTTESSIEIISQDCNHVNQYKGSSQEIILHATESEGKPVNPQMTLVDFFDSSGQGKFSCSLCGALFMCEADLVKHVSTHRNGSPLVCTICRSTCINKKVMAKHLSLHHTNKLATQRKQRMFKCIYCDVEYHSKEAMQSHVQNHGEQKEDSRFECQLCYAQFASRQQLSRHKKSEHQAACPFQCDLCGARFSLKMYLSNHMRTHVNLKPHGCSYCNQRFINRSKLTLHERTHTGEKPFKCSHCEYRSSRQDNMKYHVNSRHHNRTNTKCPRCDLKFPAKELQSHLALHSTLQPYQCLECDRLFKSLGGLRVHYKSSQVHNRRIVVS